MRQSESFQISKPEITSEPVSGSKPERWSESGGIKNPIASSESDDVRKPNVTSEPWLTSKPEKRSERR